MNANEPAFPRVDATTEKMTGNQVDFHVTGGLTKREYFAAMAMQGYLSKFGDDIGNVQNRTTSIYEASVKVADGLLAELAKAEGHAE